MRRIVATLKYNKDKQVYEDLSGNKISLVDIILYGGIRDSKAKFWYENPPMLLDLYLCDETSDDNIKICYFEIKYNDGSYKTINRYGYFLMDSKNNFVPLTEFKYESLNRYNEKLNYGVGNASNSNMPEYIFLRKNGHKFKNASKIKSIGHGSKILYAINPFNDKELYDLYDIELRKINNVYYSEINDLSCNRIRVKMMDNHYNYLDKYGTLLINKNYIDATDFNPINNTAIVCEEIYDKKQKRIVNMYGIINPNSEYVISPSYDKIEELTNGYRYFEITTKNIKAWGIFNPNNKEIFRMNSNDFECKSVSKNEKAIIVKNKEGKYGVLNYFGKNITTFIYNSEEEANSIFVKDNNLELLTIIDDTNVMNIIQKLKEKSVEFPEKDYIIAKLTKMINDYNDKTDQLKVSENDDKLSLPTYNIEGLKRELIKKLELVMIILNRRNDVKKFAKGLDSLKKSKIIIDNDFKNFQVINRYLIFISDIFPKEFYQKYKSQLDKTIIIYESLLEKELLLEIDGNNILENINYKENFNNELQLIIDDINNQPLFKVISNLFAFDTTVYNKTFEIDNGYSMAINSVVTEIIGMVKENKEKKDAEKIFAEIYDWLKFYSKLLVNINNKEKLVELLHNILSKMTEFLLNYEMYIKKLDYNSSIDNENIDSNILKL